MPTEILFGSEDNTEKAAGLHVQQFVLAGERLANQSVFERGTGFHGWFLP
jgi:hypothetical protein